MIRSMENFGATKEFKERFPVQTERAKSLQEQLIRNSDNYNSDDMIRHQEEITEVADEVLNNDVYYLLSTNKKVTLTDKNKKYITQIADRLVKDGIIASGRKGGNCIICGKPFHSEDIILIEDEACGTGHAICMRCGNEGNYATGSKGTRLFYCK